MINTNVSSATFAARSPRGHSDDRTWTIAEIAEDFGVTARALRFCEEQGLVDPVRQGSQRTYGRRDRARLGWVLRAKRFGFSLVEIGKLLDLYDREDGGLAQRRAVLARCRERIGELEFQRDEIGQTIDELVRFVDGVESVAACQH